MALTNIRYGSVASSETMNNNFTYLENLIESTNETLSTSITSILSNIATINSRLNELTGDIEDSLSAMDTKIDGYKAKTKLLVSKINMLPNWAACSEIELSSSEAYTTNSNGYIVIMPEADSYGNLIINDEAYAIKQLTNSNDNAAEIIFIPVMSGDEIKSSLDIVTVYFIPSKEVSVENF